MNSRFYAQINLAPLLDVVFVTLFIVIFSVSSNYKNVADTTVQDYETELTRLTTEIEEYQNKIHELENWIALIDQEKISLSTELEQKTEELNRLNKVLIEKNQQINIINVELQSLESSLTQAKQEMERAKKELQDEIKDLQSEITERQSEASKLIEDVNKLNSQIRDLVDERTDLQVELTRNRGEIETLSQKADLEERLRIGYEQRVQLMSQQLKDPDIAAIKGAFVDKYIDIYSLHISYYSEGISRLEVIGKNNNSKSELIDNEEKTKQFLSGFLSQFNPDKTLVIFEKTQDSLYSHEQWVETHVRDDLKLPLWDIRRD